MFILSWIRIRWHWMQSHDVYHFKEGKKIDSLTFRWYKYAAISMLIHFCSHVACCSIRFFFVLKTEWLCLGDKKQPKKMFFFFSFYYSFSFALRLGICEYVYLRYFTCRFGLTSTAAATTTIINVWLLLSHFVFFVVSFEPLVYLAHRNAMTIVIFIVSLCVTQLNIIFI